MNRRRLLYISIGLLALIVLVCLFSWRTVLKNFGINFAGGEAEIVDINLPADFTATVFASGLTQPRFMAVYKDGTLFVAEGGAGRIVALPDRDGDGLADETIQIVADLDLPTSIAFEPDTWAMLVGETSQVSRFVLEDDTYQVLEQSVVVPNISTDGFHNSRTVLFGVDGRLYLSVGSTCNVCEESDPRRAAVSVFNAAGSGEQLYAKGLRNAVGMAVNPATGSIFVTVNGRDLLGDDLPPETIYRLEAGADYGWPRCHAAYLEDPDFGYEGSCEGVGEPVVQFQAHSAPLGLTFYDGDQFPGEYQGGLFVAYHGSWNRSVPTGYKVVFIPMAGDDPLGPPQDFATGWLLPDQTASGRPVGVTVAPDGSLMVSDDKAGVIYRIRYTE